MTLPFVTRIATFAYLLIKRGILVNCINVGGRAETVTSKIVTILTPRAESYKDARFVKL